jgi:hypothetical protein
MNTKPLTSAQIQRARDIASLIKLWQAGMSTVPPPPTTQFELWFKLNQDDFGIVCHGIQECCKLYSRRRGVLEFDHAVRHASKVMNCLRRDRTKSKKSAEDFPFHTLPKALSDELGLPPGLACTESMFWRCHAQLQAMHAASKRATTAAQSNYVSQN